MDSERVKAILCGTPAPRPEIQENIMVPKAISEWKARGVSRAEQVQTENRGRFLDAFARGLAVTGFTVDADGNGIFELSRYQPSGVL